MALVHLSLLKLKDFRNHSETRVAPGGAPFVLLAGPNGAGKTNILEAISLLTVGRGLRGAALSQMASAHGAGGFRVEAELVPDPDLPAITVQTFTQSDAPDRRLLRLNSANAPLSRLSEWSSQLWLTPSMDRLFADAASARRRFLDRLVLALFPGHAGHATRYEAAMRQRNRLMSQDSLPDPAWLTAIEAQMDVHGRAVAEARAEVVAALDVAMAHPSASAFPRPSLSLTEVDFSDLALRFRSNRPQDRVAGRTLIGPHRQDVQVVHREKQMPAALASTGEQKALLISILLAHARLVLERSGRAPIMLLDEAAAHLDPDRRRALFRELAELGGQSWLTGTDTALFEGLEAARYSVTDGRIIAI